MAAAASAGPAATVAARRTAAASEIENMPTETVGIARERFIGLAAEALRLPAMVSSLCDVAHCAARCSPFAGTDDEQTIFAAVTLILRQDEETTGNRGRRRLLGVRSAPGNYVPGHR